MDHGTNYCYKSGCRCDDCKGWNARKSRRYRRERMERTGEIMLQGRFYPGAVLREKDVKNAIIV